MRRTSAAVRYTTPAMCACLTWFWMQAALPVSTSTQQVTAAAESCRLQRCGGQYAEAGVAIVMIDVLHLSHHQDLSPPQGACEFAPHGCRRLRRPQTVSHRARLAPSQLELLEIVCSSFQGIIDFAQFSAVALSSSALDTGFSTHNSGDSV